MSKVDFSKTEIALSNTLRKIYIDQLSLLANIATLVNPANNALAENKITETLDKLRAEILHLKKHDSKLYQRLEISSKEEQLIFSSKLLKSSGWARLGKLKQRIEDLKKELYGEMTTDPAFEKQVETERKKHINKRFNIRENWLPLH